MSNRSHGVNEGHADENKDNNIESEHAESVEHLNEEVEDEHSYLLDALREEADLGEEVEREDLERSCFGCQCQCRAQFTR